MFEFEKQILKAENRFPMESYFYEVIALTEAAKWSFSKYNSGIDSRIITSLEEKKAIISQYLNENKEPLIGIVSIYANDPNWQLEVERVVVRSMAKKGVPRISYHHLSDSYTAHSVFAPLELNKDFKIKIIEKVNNEPPAVKLTFDDIKAL